LACQDYIDKAYDKIVGSLTSAAQCFVPQRQKTSTTFGGVKSSTVLNKYRIECYTSSNVVVDDLAKSVYRIPTTGVFLKTKLIIRRYDEESRDPIQSQKNNTQKLLIL